MNLEDMKGAIVLLALISLIGAASAIALDDFQSETTTDSYAYNITTNGLDGIDEFLFRRHLQGRFPQLGGVSKEVSRISYIGGDNTHQHNQYGSTNSPVHL